MWNRWWLRAVIILSLTHNSRSFYFFSLYSFVLFFLTSYSFSYCGVANPLCQEGQGERTLKVFAPFSRFFLFFPIYPLFFPNFPLFPRIYPPLSPIFGEFSAVRWDTLPPAPYWLRYCFLAPFCSLRTVWELPSLSESCKRTRYPKFMYINYSKWIYLRLQKKEATVTLRICMNVPLKGIQR